MSPTTRQIPTRYSPVRHSTRHRRDFRVRLACVRHAASVQSEPGSNSSVQVCGHLGHDQSLLDVTSSGLKMLRRYLLAELQPPTEHPHKLPDRIVKEPCHHSRRPRPTILSHPETLSSQSPQAPILQNPLSQRRACCWLRLVAAREAKEAPGLRPSKKNPDRYQIRAFT